MIGLLKHARSRRARAAASDHACFYGSRWTAGARERWQLTRLNAQWTLICEQIPNFHELRMKDRIPGRFSTWRQFRESVPTMDRRLLQDARNSLTSRARKPDGVVTTGGSTSQPLQLPVWTSERAVAGRNQWYARSWYGVTPGDRLFLLWGHSHLLGRGVIGWSNGLSRRLKDRVLGYCRWSAYDLGEDSLRRAGRRLLEFRPAYVVGYSAALDRFARVNADLATAFRALRLRVAIATAEAFSFSDSARIVGDVLGCPVVMEYGTAETGPLAHQAPDGLYRVFWRDYYLEGENSSRVPGASDLLVTALYPRCVPLVRYRLGDLVADGGPASDLGEQFGQLIGRANELIVLPDGTAIHSEAVAHAVRDLPEIVGYQVVQSNNRGITLRYVARSMLPQGVVDEIRRRLRTIHVQLAAVRFERVNRLEQTIAGKTARIVSSDLDATMTADGAIRARTET